MYKACLPKRTCAELFSEFQVPDPVVKEPPMAVHMGVVATGLLEAAQHRNMAEFERILGDVTRHVQSVDALFFPGVDLRQVSHDLIHVFVHVVPDIKPVMAQIVMFLVGWTFHIEGDDTLPFSDDFQLLDNCLEYMKHADVRMRCAVIQLLANLACENERIALWIIGPKHLIRDLYEAMNSNDDTVLIHIARIIKALLPYTDRTIAPERPVLDIRDLVDVDIGWYNILGEGMEKWKYPEYFEVVEEIVCRREFYQFNSIWYRMNPNGQKTLASKYAEMNDVQMQCMFRLIRNVHRRQAALVQLDPKFERWDLCCVDFRELAYSFSCVVRSVETKLSYFKFLSYVIDVGNQFLLCAIGLNEFFVLLEDWLQKEAIKVKVRMIALLEQLFTKAATFAVVPGVLSTHLLPDLIDFIREYEDESVALQVLNTIACIIDSAERFQSMSSFLEHWKEFRMDEILGEMATDSDVPQAVAELAHTVGSQGDKMVELAAREVEAAKARDEERKRKEAEHPEPLLLCIQSDSDSDPLTQALLCDSV